ncbi:MAG: ABC transporter ATP-binding protein [Corynebacterium sp.]|nr:ABC transporter ATP-binding protein [Corynebacterium sp.]
MNLKRNIPHSTLPSEIGTEHADNTYSPATALSISNLCVSLGKYEIIHDLSIDVPTGHMVGLLGPNGTGKTTLLRTVAGILQPSAGHIRVYGANINSLTPRQRARQLTYIGQEEVPAADFSVSQVLAMARLPYRSRLPWSSSSDSEGPAAIARAAKLMQIEDLLEAPCHKLSGGQKRRVVLARGLAQDTPVLILDEPTNHLDIHHQLELLTLLQQAETTVLCSLHDVDLAHGFCDQVGIIDQGHLAAFDPTASALTPELIAQVFGVHSSLVHSDTREHLVIERALTRR